MQAGDTIRMLRDYDGGVGWVADTEWVVGYGDGEILPGNAESLVGPAADGGGPYAEVVEDEPVEEGKE